MLVLAKTSRGPTLKADAEKLFLDARGLSCPMPLLKAKKMLNEMAEGEVLAIEATDPTSMKDFEIFARQSGHLLLEASKRSGVYVYCLQKSSVKVADLNRGSN